ncbi:hypothetical protein DI005_20120 [Prauserella sp. PE36]|uniref:hypothetical protein n=1 Tax=Prauserella sp. PE36 TaxID=1504709 RepID=UPI000DE414C8|nr:hypothetical protein [Prauserella sp. PE36]RBM18101.1 hypothetical protein DI005_20120 [Prauserella sp. PE36]
MSDVRSLSQTLAEHRRRIGDDREFISQANAGDFGEEAQSVTGAVLLNEPFMDEATDAAVADAIIAQAH